MAESARECSLHVSADPIGDKVLIVRAGCDSEHEFDGFVLGVGNRHTVRLKEPQERELGKSLVAVGERMVS